MVLRAWLKPAWPEGMPNIGWAKAKIPLPGKTLERGERYPDAGSMA